MADVVLNATHKRLLAEIDAFGLYPDQAEILTTAFILAKRHSEKAARLKHEAEIGLADVEKGRWEVANNPPPGSVILPLVASHTAWADIADITQADPEEKQIKFLSEFLRRVSNTAKRPTNLFRRSCLPPATRIVFVWPHMALVRFTPQRNELLRVLHSNSDAPDVFEAEED